MTGMCATLRPPETAIRSETQPLCRTHGLSRNIEQRRILRNIDLEVYPGERIALTGSNGAGKTTLLRCLAAAIRPTGGMVEWSFGSRAVPEKLREQLGVVAHDTRLHPNLTASENLMFAARMCGLPNPETQVHRWLQQCGLSAAATRPCDRLSRGMLQRLAVARSLIHEPQLILLDEPFSGLDSSGCEWLCELLRDFSNRGHAVVFATHEPRWVTELATRIWILESGRLKESICDC
ncbi:MAG: heme ABC exporter ATP-binding protein CcmA [Planctomycetaceae bacterium]|nr:heme ABC exporter ATP-binding protein CcmA [Planctomycetaceae bacterium]